MSVSPQDARSLGHLLCTTTAEVLWQPARGWIRERHPGTLLACRVGAGQATYHRFDPRLRQHSITFGARMIIAKHRPDTAAGWLSSREILNRGYFDGQLSTLNLLAHTCCHEFAHLLQHVAGKRKRGSVHNRHFYEILDNLHASGAAQSVRTTMQHTAPDHGLSLPDQPFAIASSGELLAQWQVGDAVGFGSDAHWREGVVQRINRKTCTVAGTGASHGLRYRVPASMLRRLET
nr:hypothetical protein [Marinobacter caseinilyticus]